MLPHIRFCSYTVDRAMVVVEARPFTFATKATTMILAFALCLSATAALAWLIFSLAVYALPAVVGGLLGWLAYSSGSGLVGAGLVALVVGALAYAVGQIASERARSPALRWGILCLYAAPAAVAGFFIVDGLAASVVPQPAWRIVFAIAGGCVVAASAWARMTTFAPPGAPGGVGEVSVARS